MVLVLVHHCVRLLFTCLLCAREHACSVLCTYMLHVDKCAMYGAGAGHRVLLLFTCLLCAREHARSVLCTYMLYM